MDIIWTALGRKWGAEILNGPLCNAPTDVNAIRLVFSEEARFKELCGAREGTADDWLGYLINEYLSTLLDDEKSRKAEYRIERCNSWLSYTLPESED